MPSGDVEVFNSVIDELFKKFKKNPFEFTNEESIKNELYRRLYRGLENPEREVNYKTDYGDENRWRVNKSAKFSKETSLASRVRCESAFIHNGEPLKSGSGKAKKYDLMVLKSETRIIMQSKKPGPSNHWDTQNEISLLCEIKHSRNMVNRFYSSKQGAKDVKALSEHPSDIEKRAFLFFDWWPKDYYGNWKFEDRFGKLKERIKSLDNPIDIIYLPREGSKQEKTIA